MMALARSTFGPRDPALGGPGDVVWKREMGALFWDADVGGQPDSTWTTQLSSVYPSVRVREWP